MEAPDRRIGITSTVPAEAILAAGLIPIDLNNAFIAHPERAHLIELAERDGFPAGVCSWIKGIYGAVVRDDIRAVVAVTTGDCSNTVALADVLEDRGVRVIRFAYPAERTRYEFERAWRSFCSALGVTAEEANDVRERLIPLRGKLREVDALTWYKNRVTGFENHRLLVAASDFEGDPEAFEKQLGEFLEEARVRQELPDGPRVGIAGVPPILDDLHAFLEDEGVRVVFNETQRQFAMPHQSGDLVEQYLRYTYPYDFKARLADIREEVRRRRCRGLIHYVQSFCHRGIEDILLRRHVDVPVLTLEGERPGPMDGRLRVRVQAFVEMLRREDA